VWNAQLVNSKGIQFVASILKDKLPEELNRKEFFVVKEKLLRIGGQRKAALFGRQTALNLKQHCKTPKRPPE
jgi:hypothetical protein